MHDSVSLIPELEVFIISMLEYKLHFKTFRSKKIIFALTMEMNKTEWQELGRSNFKSAVLKKKIQEDNLEKTVFGKFSNYQNHTSSIRISHDFDI